MHPGSTPAGAFRSRRAVLRALVGVGGATIAATGPLAGCGLFASSSPNPAAPARTLTGFLAATVALGDQYDAILAAVPALAPTLTPVRDAHRAHAQALAGTLGTALPKATASPTAVPSDRVGAVASLAAAEKLARDEAVAACLASATRTAALVGSIAAARASHLELLT